MGWHKAWSLYLLSFLNACLIMSKTELLLLSPSISKPSPLIVFPISVNDNSILPVALTKNLGIIQDLSLSLYIQSVCKLKILPSQYVQNLTTSQLSNSNHSGLSHHNLSPGLLQEPHFISLSASYVLLNNKPSWYKVAYNNNHFIMLTDSAGQKFRNRCKRNSSSLFWYLGPELWWVS